MIIAPSLLASDFGRFASEATRIERANADWIHCDIMDGTFVPNISFGPAVVKAVDEVTNIPLDVHLMCCNPETLFAPFAKAGADILTIHVELGNKVQTLIWQIRGMGKKVGLAINPPTSIDLVKPFLNSIDLLLIMTVNPGFGGQSFIHECVPKIQQAAAWRKQLALEFNIEVDGGITDETAAECAQAGADVFVSGTALLCHRQLKSAVTRMRRIVNSAVGSH